MNRMLTILISIVFVAYPAFIYIGLTTFSPASLALIMLALLLLRLSTTLRLTWASAKPLLPITIAAIIPAILSLIFNSERALLLMPVVVNVTLCLTFGWTLFRGPNMIARFAALSEPVITSGVLGYCRKVTIAWCVFFVVNGTIAAYTVFFSTREYWTLYNGLISYILIGLLFGAEWLVRKKVKRKE
ncbi:MAG: hypothetical protein JXX14_22660 [Deltaproteobacteria bacterium]|nr:hypothetical protein [Deltaproteobacteria bacterium]